MWDSGRPCVLLSSRLTIYWFTLHILVGCLNISHFTFTLLTLPPFASTLLFANPAVGNLALSPHVVLGHMHDCMRATTCSPISPGPPSSLPSHSATIIIFVCLSHIALAVFHHILTNVFHAGQHCCLWSVSDGRHYR